MNKLQSVLLDTFKDLIDFLEKNDISYFTCGGTTLGAVRHHGFIPWDDDIDIYVPRKDYDRMLSLRHHLDESRNKLMCIQDYPYHYSYARFYNQEYYISSTDDALFHEGPFIDIIPLDEADDDIERTKQLESAYIGAAKSYRCCVCHKSWKNIIKMIIKGKVYLGFCWIRRNLFYPHKKMKYYLDAFLKAEEDCRNTHGKYNFCYFHTYSIEKELFPKEIFSEYIKLPFESLEVRVPKMYHEYLSQLFGDYMQLPPVEKRKVHFDNDKDLIKVK